MGETAESFYLAGRDAATQEREERLAKAKRKLKSYRAKQAKSGSSNTSLDPTSRPSSAADGSTNIHRRSISRSGILNLPVASTSKSISVAGHSKKSSLSRTSRNSFSHNHSKSKASISISVSAPTSNQESSYNPSYTSEASSSIMSSFDNSYAAPLKPNRNSWTSQLNTNTNGLRDDASTSTSLKRLSNSLDPRSAFNSPSPSPSPLLQDNSNLTSHNRKSSRHSRRISVTNFRESMEIVSGQGNYSGVLTPTISSFAAPPQQQNSYELSPSGSPNLTWSNDPIKVLEALKERGRQETEMENDQKRTRLGALEALEGRLSAPSEMIDLGNEAEGQLLHAPPSPGYTSTSINSAPSSPTPIFSPMYGLGLVGNTSTPVSLKRNSWSAPGPVTAAGAKGALDLGMLIEEEEEEEEDEQDEVSALTSPLRKSRSSSTKRRPSSLALITPSYDDTVAVSSPLEEPPLSASFSARPMRLSMSSSTSSNIAPLSTSTSSHYSEQQQQQQSRPSAPLRSLTLGSTPHSAPLSREPSVEELSPNDRRQSLLYTHSTDTSPVAAAPRGLRPLSIGSFPTSNSPSDFHQIKQRSPIQSRTALPSLSNSLNSNNNLSMSTPPPRTSAPTASKRSSISYRTSSVASLASSEGPLSASAQAARRPWRTSMSGTSISSTSSSIPGPPLSSNGGNLSGFGFSSSHGAFGGFGDLQVDEEEEGEGEESDLHIRPESSLGGGVSAAAAASAREEVHLATTEALNTQINTLQFQLEQVNSTLESQTIRHGIEMEEFEKRAGEEAKGMRIRISELEKQIEEITVLRRFESEGLSREIEQAKEALTDLVEERDSLVEDVDGWRERCSTLEKMVKKDREDESMSNAQIKLIGEMRDQIYNLVAALDRERADHDETRLEVEKILVESATSPILSDEEEIEDQDQEEVELNHQRVAIDGSNHRHAFKTASDASVTSSFGYQSISGNTTEATSNGTDSEDNASKASSPTSSQHSSFPGSKSHENDFANAIAMGGLQTLAEEEEEIIEEEQQKQPEVPIVIKLEEEVEAIKLEEIIQPVVLQQEKEVEVVLVQVKKEVENFPLAVKIPERERDEDRIRMGSGSTGSTEESEVMPMTPSKESMNHHNRSDSFVRHWSFPKGSISSVRISEDDDHSFFDLNRHTSLPALPIPESILPPFLCADLMVDEEQFAPFIPITTSPIPKPQDRSTTQFRSPVQERLSPSAPIRSPIQSGGRISPQPPSTIQVRMNSQPLSPIQPPTSTSNQGRQSPQIRPYPNSNTSGRMSPQILSPTQRPNQGRMSPQVLSPTTQTEQQQRGPGRMSPQIRSHPPPPPPQRITSPSNQGRNYPPPPPPLNQSRNGPPPPSHRPPPVSPSGLHQSTFGSSVSSQGSFSYNSPSRLARLGQLSLTNIVTSLGGWSPSNSVSAVTSAVTAGKLSRSTNSNTTTINREDEEERMFLTENQQVKFKTPSSLAYESRSVQNFINHHEQPRPLPSRLSRLDFRPVCCTADNTPIFTL